MRRFRYRLGLLLAVLLALPQYAAAEDALLMGVFPRRNATLTAQLFSPLAEYLSEQLQRPVRLVTAKDFPSFWQGVVEKRYDIVHYNQYHYIQSASDYAVIACNEEEGRDVISGALYVRRDSGITEVSQLRGRSVIFGGGPDAMMSHIIPRYLLYEAGLGPNDFEAHFAANPPNAVLGVYFRQADAGGAGDVVMNLPMVTKIAGKDELAYLAVSAPVKNLPWAVRKDMPQTLRADIQNLMVELAHSERGRTILKTARLTGMSYATDSDYDSARNIIRKVMPLAPE